MEARAAATARRARKVGGSYQATGTVVSRFKTLAGRDRVVFEFDSPAGMLHIFDEGQLEYADGETRVRASEMTLDWDGLVSVGKAQVPESQWVNGLPWSFSVLGAPVTHENDQCYVVAGEHVHPGDEVTVVGPTVYVRRV